MGIDEVALLYPAVSEPRSGLKVHIALVKGQHSEAPLACTVGLTSGERPDPRTPLWPQAQPGDLVKMVNPPDTHTRKGLSSAVVHSSI